jgi:starch phosphorylase
VDENSDDDRRLTENLYTADCGVRIRQEQLLGVGGLRALGALGQTPRVLHLNEGHSAFAVLELARWMAQAEKRGFPEVAERVAERTVFTTHTPVDAGHDRFDPNLVETTLGPLRNQLGLSQQDFLGLGRVHPHDQHEPFCMTTLALNLSRARNGVSGIHGRISRGMWHALWPRRPQHEVPIGQITNGVHVASWLAPPVSDPLPLNWARLGAS